MIATLAGLADLAREAAAALLIATTDQALRLLLHHTT